MAKPRYNYAHQQERLRWAPVVASGQALCMQTDPADPRRPPGSGCIMSTRHIPPGSPWHLAHDATGTVVLGPAHARCNLRDGAVRGNRARARKPRRRWAL